MHESSLSLCRRVLDDERGIALPYRARGDDGALGARGRDLHVHDGEPGSSRSGSRLTSEAYGLAETGLSYALSRLQNAADPDERGQRPVDDGVADRRHDDVQRIRCRGRRGR